VIGSVNRVAGLKTLNAAQILGLSGAFPDVMIVVAGKIEDVLLKKRFAIVRKDQLDEALKRPSPPY
jgi:hypothetical protein